MKKAFGGDSPLWQGAGKSFWTLPILHQWWWRLAVCFEENWLGSFRFSHRGEYIGGRAASGGGPGAHTRPRRGQGVARTMGGVAALWLPSISTLDSVSCWKNRNFGFCFVQFREYFLCSFSETQKQQKTRNWHCGISLVGQFSKMHKNATKCNKTQSKWCINKHGASKIIDTFETYQSRAAGEKKPPCLLNSCA
jgi:hypothetical protein